MARWTSDVSSRVDLTNDPEGNKKGEWTFVHSPLSFVLFPQSEIMRMVQ